MILFKVGNECRLRCWTRTDGSRYILAQSAATNQQLTQSAIRANPPLLFRSLFTRFHDLRRVDRLFDRPKGALLPAKLRGFRR